MFNEQKYKSIKIGKDKYLSEIIDSDQTVFGDSLNAIRILNEVFIQNNPTYVHDLKNLDKVVSYRNYFSHTYRKKLDKTKTSQFTVDMIEAINLALFFEKKYCAQK